MPTLRSMTNEDTREYCQEHVVENDEEYEEENTTTTKMVCIAQNLWSVSKIYLFWILVHLLSVNLYCYFCANLSIFGLITSPFAVVAPHCKALGWLMSNSTIAISNMWVILAGWLLTKIPLVTR